MAHELLSVKLCELDEKLGRLHSRIQFSQTSDREAGKRRRSSSAESARGAAELKQKAEVQQVRDGWENIRNL